MSFEESKLAVDLSGRGIGKLIEFRHYTGDIISAPILMITHKKNGDVNVRVGRTAELKFGAELTFSKMDKIELRPA